MLLYVFVLGRIVRLVNWVLNNFFKFISLLV